MPFTGEHHFILDNIEHRYQVFTGEAPDPTLVQVGDLFHPQDVGPYCEILVCKYTSGSIRQSWVPFSLVLPVKHPKHLARILLNPMGLWKSQKTARRQWEDIKSSDRKRSRELSQSGPSGMEDNNAPKRQRPGSPTQLTFNLPGQPSNDAFLHHDSLLSFLNRYLYPPLLGCPATVYGKRVVEKLLLMKPPSQDHVVFFPLPKCTIEPEFSHVMADLIGAQGPIACMDLLATTKSTQLYPEQIFADLMCGDNGWGKGRRFITILALPCTSNGLESCKIPIPGQVLDMNPVVASVRNSSGQVVPGYRSTLTQPGAFTDPHIDGISQSQWIFQIHGEKLWLVWPPTEQNLRVLKQSNSYPASHNQHIVLEFLEALEKLQIFIIHPGQSFILPNGFIHACLSLTVSAHTGVEFYTPSDPGTTLRLTETARDTVESRRECGVFKEDTVDTAKEEHYIWLHCLDKSRIDRRLRKHIVANFKACIPEGEMEEHERGMRDRKGRDDKLYIRPSWQ